MGKNLLLIGRGGHCSSVLDSVLSLGDYGKIGIIDEKGDSLFSVPVIGTDEDLERLYSEGFKNAFIIVGSVGDTSVRKKIYKRLKEIGFEIETIIDPSALIAVGCEIGEGTFVGKNAVVNSGTKTDECTIINTGSIVEHDCNNRVVVKRLRAVFFSWLFSPFRVIIGANYLLFGYPDLRSYPLARAGALVAAG